LIGRVLLLYLHSLKLLAYTLVGLCGNIDWTILSIIEVAHMWAAVIYLVHTPHCDLLEHVKHRKEQLLQAANVWTAMQDVSFFYSPMNYCRISMSHAGDYDGMAELQSGFCRWQQEQRRVIGCLDAVQAKQRYVRMEKHTAYVGVHLYVFMPTTVLPPVNAIAAYEKFAIRLFKGCLNKEQYVVASYAVAAHRVVSNPPSHILPSLTSPCTAYLLQARVSQEEGELIVVEDGEVLDVGVLCFYCLYDMLLHLWNGDLVGDVQLHFGSVDMSPYRRVKLMFGDCVVSCTDDGTSVCNVSSVVKLCDLIPFLVSRTVSKFSVTSVVTRTEYFGEYDNCLQYMITEKLSGRDVFDLFTFEQIVQMWRLARALPRATEKIVATAVTAAAIRLHVPLVHSRFLQLKVPWLPRKRHLIMLTVIRTAIAAAGLHPITGGSRL
jgi:hypothetical protein